MVRGNYLQLFWVLIKMELADKVACEGKHVRCNVAMALLLNRYRDRSGPFRSSPVWPGPLQQGHSPREPVVVGSCPTKCSRYSRIRKDPAIAKVRAIQTLPHFWQLTMSSAERGTSSRLVESNGF